MVDEVIHFYPIDPNYPETARKSGTVKIESMRSGTPKYYAKVSGDNKAYHFGESDCRQGVWKKISADTRISFKPVQGERDPVTGFMEWRATDVEILEPFSADPMNQ